MADTALLDANVLHPMVLCDTLIRLAQRGMYQARWSREILQETIDSIARRRPDISPQVLQRRVEQMNLAVADAEVDGCHERLSTSLTEFGSDAHVVAAAIVGRADVIVTQNLKDFPVEPLRQFNLTAQHPDDFLLAHWDRQPEIVLSVLEQQAAALTSPPMSPKDVIERLRPMTPRFAGVVAAAMEAKDC